MLTYYVEAVRRAAEEKSRLEGLVGAEARKPRWRRRVDSLRCLKGVDTATAADLVFEAGEFSRFRNARSFAAWVGLTPSEHSSGESDRRGAITKAGNKHLRKTLVEAAWHYLTCSGRPKDLAKGQAPDPAVSVNIFFTIFTNVFSPIAPTRMRRIRQRGCAAFGV